MSLCIHMHDCMSGDQSSRGCAVGGPPAPCDWCGTHSETVEKGSRDSYDKVIGMKGHGTAEQHAPASAHSRQQQQQQQPSSVERGAHRRHAAATAVARRDGRQPLAGS
jgi:hypothetical protein